MRDAGKYWHIQTRQRGAIVMRVSPSSPSQHCKRLLNKTISISRSLLSALNLTICISYYSPSRRTAQCTRHDGRTPRSWAVEQEYTTATATEFTTTDMVVDVVRRFPTYMSRGRTRGARLPAYAPAIDRTQRLRNVDAWCMPFLTVGWRPPQGGTRAAPVC